MGSTTSTWPSAAAGARAGHDRQRLGAGLGELGAAGGCQLPATATVDLDDGGLVAFGIERLERRSGPKQRRSSCSLERPPASTATRTRELTGSSSSWSSPRRSDPTNSVTTVFGFSWVPPTGSCEMTMPSTARIGGVLEDDLACGNRRCRGSSARSHSPASVTSGTAEVDGPFDTVRRDGRSLRAGRAATRRLVGDDPGRLVGVLVDA